MLIIKNLILEEIRKRKEVYKTSPSDMVSAFNREIETEKEYNGRQLLELIQNADDENSTEVTIELDKSKNLLIISNRGTACTPFSANGIRSLMISNLSTKTSKKYIGNKGLGFRSIINWSRRITIHSSDLSIEFSRKTVDQVFEEIFSFEEQTNIRNERNLPQNINPIPFLSIPKLSDFQSNEWVTTIEIEYKSEFISDIEKQINELKKETLLFLNSLTRLNVVVDGEITQDILKTDLLEQWTIYERRDELPKELWDKENEKEFYDLKIALQENLSCNIKEVFAFFPTKIDIDFPFIVHGTFELNSSRNEIIDSKKNKHILKELVNLIVSTAKDIASEEVSYKAIEMLSYSYKNNILNGLGFYNEIDSAIESLEIFPCLDGLYRAKSDVAFVNSLSEFVLRTDNCSLFPNLLIPHHGVPDISCLDLYRRVNNEQLNVLSRTINSIKDRAEMIHMFHTTFGHRNKMEFLIDEACELISIEDDVYTPSSQFFSIPDYVKIKFINKDLYDHLINKFEIDSNEKARDLQRQLKEITNIQSYQPVPVLQKIISTTNKKLKEPGVDIESIIQQMVDSLYKNFLQLTNTQIPTDTKIQLLNLKGILSDSKDLYLSSSFPSGKVNDFLFENVLVPEDYLADKSQFNLQAEEPEDVERFFLWLGVNKHTKFVTNEKPKNIEYTDFVFETVKKPIGFRNQSLIIKKIADLNKIAKNLSPEKLVLWMCIDEKIHEQLNDTSNSDVFRYDKSGEHTGYYSHIIHTKPSYIVYQIKSLSLFDDFFIGNESLNHLINDFSFNFEDESFENYGFNRADIDSVLLKIGAVDKFERLSISKVRDIIQGLPDKSPLGKQTQAIYRLCIKHYEKNKTPLNSDDKQIFLYADKSEEKGYFPLREIFYNGNIKLPKRIASTKAILNFPRRQNTSNVIGFFDINNLNELEITVRTKQVIQNLSDEFLVLFNQIKPCVLAYRIQNNESDKFARDELAKLRKIDIQLCTELKYTVDTDEFSLDNYDYVRDGNNYYIKINPREDFEELRGNFDFQDCFADIVGLVFDIQDTKVFRDMLKEDISYIERTIKYDLGIDDLIKARELFGVSDEYYSFWKTIYELQGKEYLFESDENLLKKIEKNLELSTDISTIDYSQLNSYENTVLIKKLFDELNIDIGQFNKVESSYYKLDFFEFHRRKLKQEFERMLFSFKKTLYSWCINNSSEEKFTTLVSQYEHNSEFILMISRENKFKLTIDYLSIIDQFISSNFQLDDSQQSEVDFISIYEDNEKEVDIDILDGDIQYLSLLYFPHKLNDVLKHVKDKINQIQIQNQVNSFKAGSNVKEGTLKEIKDATFGIPNSNSKFKTNKPFKHSSSVEQGKKAKGNSSEKDVYIALVDEFGKENVTWVSKDDDSCGYDIKYINKSGITKYVEVKTFSGCKFYITRNEIEFAKSNKGSYEIFLVGDDIKKISDIDFDNKDMFRLESQEFLVHYNIT